MESKQRLDKYMVEQRRTETRTAAQQHILAGHVFVDGQLITKAGFAVTADQAITLAFEAPAFVGRGGQKLDAALTRWQIDLSGRTCLDIGISTGGFTDCMLQHGAATVVGVDSGHGQLAARLRGHPQLRLLERTNARYLTPEQLPESIAFFSMDVSFIAASLVLPAVIASAFHLQPSIAGEVPREAVILVKPQFEAGREYVGKHGLVRSAEAHQRAVDRVKQTVCNLGASATDVMDSPIAGGDGNREFLLYARF